MSQGTIAVLVVAVPAIIGLLTAVWQQRKGGPDAVASLVGSSNEFSDRLMSRIAVLEARVTTLEVREAAHTIEINAYRALYGPLPTVGDTPGED